MYFMVASRLSGSGRRDRPHPYDVRRWSVSTASVASSLLLLRPCQQQAPDALTLTAGRHEDLGQLARQSPGPDRMTRIPPDGRRGSLVAGAIGAPDDHVPDESRFRAFGSRRGSEPMSMRTIAIIIMITITNDHHYEPDHEPATQAAGAEHLAKELPEDEHRDDDDHPDAERDRQHGGAGACHQAVAGRGEATPGKPGGDSGVQTPAVPSTRPARGTGV